jgi:hypothetical protein
MEATGEPGEYRMGVVQCSDCGSTLVEAIPEWAAQRDAEQKEFVEVLTLDGPAMVSFVRSLLQPAGIPFFIRNEMVNRFGMGVGGAPVLLVESSKVEEAKELLAAIDDELEDDA